MSRERLERALRRTDCVPSIVAYLTAGYPDRPRFFAALDALEEVADAIEIGVPFTDPMADGATITRASHVALANGVTLDRLLTDLEARPHRIPRVLMSYLNPLLAIDADSLAPRLARAQVDAIVVPDLPHDEGSALGAALARADIALAPMITPLTTEARLGAIAANARGFVYAVTRVGTTGRETSATPALGEYLDRARRACAVPVIAGFGVRRAEHVAALCPPADGVVVGTAIVEALDRGEPIDELVASLRGDTRPR